MGHKANKSTFLPQVVDFKSENVEKSMDGKDVAFKSLDMGDVGVFNRTH